MNPFLAAAGAALVLISLIDVAWTVLAVSSGKGPITSMLARGLWRLALMVPSRFNRRLQYAGYLILVLTLATWLLVPWAGWALVFTADPDAVINAVTGEAVPNARRLLWAGGAIVTMSAVYSAGSTGWELAHALAPMNGLLVVTLSLAFLVQVTTAAAFKQRVALALTALGPAPQVQAIAAAGEARWGTFGQHVIQITHDMAEVTRRHLAFPVLHHLHTADDRAEIEPGLAVLDDALTVLEHGVESREDMIIDPIRVVIDDYLDTVRVSLRETDPPPIPDLDPLRRAGIHVVDDQTFAERVAGLADRRSRMRSWLDANGWPYPT